MFNDQPTLSYHALLQHLQVTDQELKSHLIPLCQFKILSKQPTGKEFKMEDQFSVNFNFHSNIIKVKIPVVHSKVQKSAESQDLQKKVEDDRKHIIDATLVKVMKARRKLDHNTLISETTKILALKFMPNVANIKQRIEGLIEREYIERDKEDRRFYKYLA